MTNVNVANDRVRVAKKRRRARVYYAAGPGNLIGAYQQWRDGDHPTDVVITYSSQFFEVCRRLDAEGYAVASSPDYPEDIEVREGPYRVRHRPCPWERWQGPMFHVGEYIGTLWHIASILRYGAWYLFSVLRLFGIEVVPVLMVVLWAKYKPMGKGRRFLMRLNRHFFRRSISAVVSMSEDCSRQVREISNGRPAPIELFVPKFCPDLFKGLEPPAPSPPFRVLYAGRIERYKGVFDLLEIARRFAAEGRTDVEFDLCGGGSASDELRRDVEQAGLAGRFRMHGHCDQKALIRMYGSSHVVIVPTRTEFVEGFNQVLVEAVISGKPVITSSVCPALENVREAAVEVPPDDVNAYGDAILRLRDDPAFYAQKQRACPAVRDQYLNSDLTFDNVIGRILGTILEPRRLIDPRP
jgi:glycogen synthase